MMSGVPGPPPGGGNLMGPDQNQSNMLNMKPEPEFKTEVFLFSHYKLFKYNVLENAKWQFCNLNRKQKIYNTRRHRFF